MAPKMQLLCTIKNRYFYIKLPLSRTVDLYAALTLATGLAFIALLLLSVAVHAHQFEA
jgi:hypothetical protein